MRYSSGMGWFVTYHVMTKPGRRNRGPPYSQPQFPGGSCSCSKNERPLLIASSGVLAGGFSGKSYTANGPSAFHKLL